MHLVLFCVSPVILLNVHESMRFKAGGVRFLGCFLVYNYDAALGSRAVKSKRALQLHHYCCTTAG